MAGWEELGRDVLENLLLPKPLLARGVLKRETSTKYDAV